MRDKSAFYIDITGKTRYSQILQFILNRKWFVKTTLEKEFPNVPRADLTRYLITLVKNGIIIEDGRHRPARYIVPNTNITKGLRLIYNINIEEESPPILQIKN